MQHWLPGAARHDGGLRAGRVKEVARLVRHIRNDGHVAARSIHDATPLHLAHQGVHAVVEADRQQQIGPILRRLRRREPGDSARPRIHAVDGLAQIDGQQRMRRDEADCLRRAYLVGQQFGLSGFRVPTIDLVHRRVGEEEMALIVSGHA